MNPLKIPGFNLVMPTGGDGDLCWGGDGDDCVEDNCDVVSNTLWLQSQYEKESVHMV